MNSLTKKNCVLLIFVLFVANRIRQSWFFPFYDQFVCLQFVTLVIIYISCILHPLPLMLLISCSSQTQILKIVETFWCLLADNVLLYRLWAQVSLRSIQCLGLHAILGSLYYLLDSKGRYPLQMLFEDIYAHFQLSLLFQQFLHQKQDVKVFLDQECN